MDITERVVLISGGGSGIGLALAKRLIEQNNDVIICGRNPEKLEDAAAGLGPRCEALICDISSPDSVAMLYGRVAQRFGSLDILVNNAGIARSEHFVESRDALRSIDEELDVNVRGTLRMTKTFLPLLMRSNEAAILNVTSLLAQVPLHLTLGYSMSKAALHSFTVSLRRHLAPSGIDVFELLPPFVDTDMTAGVDADKLDPDKLARETIKTLKRGTYEIYPGIAKVVSALNRIFPDQARQRVLAASADWRP